MKKLNFENNLKSEFKLRQLTVTKVAKECHIPQSVLHGWLNGTLPSAKNIHHVKTLCEYLGVTIDKILFDIDSKDKKIIFQQTFKDGVINFTLTVEKANENEK